ncbi:MAG: hypothetical protein AAF555_11950 [Verrucomicrobiota bacterium]
MSTPSPFLESPSLIVAWLLKEDLKAKQFFAQILLVQAEEPPLLLKEEQPKEAESSRQMSVELVRGWFA